MKIMKNITTVATAVLSITLGLTACTGEVTFDHTGRGVVDVVALGSECVVTLDSNTGTVDVPMVIAVPEIEGVTIAEVMNSAVSFTVKNNVTGITVNLTEGDLVTGTPSAIGEWMWTIDDTRTLITVTFYNESSEGVLGIGGDYSATLTVNHNYVLERVGTFAFDVTVE